MDMILSIGSVAGAILGLFLLVVVTIFVLRGILKSNAGKDLTEKYRDKKWASPISAFNKYPDVNAFKYTGPLFKFGAVIALAAVLLGFSATQFEKEIYIPDDALVYEEIEQAPPRTAEPPPPPPPPPPPVIEEVPDEEIIEDPPEFEDQTIDDETVIDDTPPEVKAPPPPPPPPPPPAPETDEVFLVVEQNPRFPGCDNISGSKEEKDKCAQGKLLEYIYGNLKYPAIARENGVEGRVILQFVVDKDGKITDIEVARGIGAGCDEAAVKVVEGMNNLPQRWTPGKQRGKPVKVKYTLPIKFELQ